MAHKPNLTHERTHGGIVAGIDEAGRGPWAGPVVAAAAILGKKRPPHMNDSKKLKAQDREAIFNVLITQCTYGVGIATTEEIDSLNILQATKLAMVRAFKNLGTMPCAVLIDGNQPPVLPCKVQAIIGGDGESLTIAAASIIAKVTRDRMMRQLALEHPGYGWERNAGYGTQCHQDAIATLGVTIHHRRSFRPIREILEKLSAEKLSA